VNSSNKLPEIKKDAFTKARESLGLSAKDLSVMACLSVRQIEQIENGETSAFYGPQIKHTAAKKVAGILKLKEDDAFDIAITVPPVQEIVPNAESSAIENSSATAITIKNEEAVAKVAETNTPDPDKELEEQSKGDQAGNFNLQAKHSKRNFYILAGIVVAFAFSVINLRTLIFPSLIKEQAVVVEQSQTVSPTDTPGESKAPLTTSASESVAANAAPTSIPVVTSSIECPPADGMTVSFKADAAKKAGDMVYMQSKIAQIICVVDAAGKMQNKNFEPGAGASFYGKPPLRVLTSGVAQVDIYYQGVKVRPSNSAAKNIILEPAEIIQPSAPTDSQFR
jgi:transcriptional regulator with XRE-family HTH domain